MIAGATGAVGERMVDVFAAAPGWQVVGLCRNPPEDARANVRYVRTDLLDLDSCRRSVAEAGAVTQRTVRPVGIVYYAETIVLAAWCELRGDFRHFRPDRFEAVRVLEERFVGEGEALRRDWAAVHLAGL